MQIAVIGSGYVGLVVGACFADVGHAVRLVDRDPARVAALEQGRCPLFEPGLPELLARGRAEGQLLATTDLAAALDGADAVFLAVGTPPRPDGEPDLTDVLGAVDQVVDALRGPTVLVLKSTVPVGTHARVEARVRARTAHDVAVVANPEFLKEGAAVRDFRRPERVIVGTRDPRAIALLRRLYRPFMMRTDRLLVMDPTSAELAKYASNAMLATRVSFMNELARVCEAVGGDVEQVRVAMGSDARIGPHYLYASLGYGGSCLPKDVRALLHTAEAVGQPLTLLAAAHAANAAQRAHWGQRVRSALGEVRGAVLAVWGLAFKAGTDDVRESASVALVEDLRQAGAHLRLHDPQAAGRAREVLGDEAVTWCEGRYDAVEGADALIVCTEWTQYRTPDFARMARVMRRPLLLDGRNLYDPAWIAETPFEYWSVGRPVQGAPPDR